MSITVDCSELYSLDHDDPIDLVFAPSELVQDLIGDITGDVVVVTRSGVRQDDGRSSDLERLQGGLVGDVTQVEEHTQAVHLDNELSSERPASQLGIFRCTPDRIASEYRSGTGRRYE